MSQEEQPEIEPTGETKWRRAIELENHSARWTPGSETGEDRGFIITSAKGLSFKDFKISTYKELQHFAKELAMMWQDHIRFETRAERENQIATKRKPKLVLT